MTHFLTPWNTFWRNYELLNVMMCSLLQGEFVVVMTYFMTSFLVSWDFFHHFGNKIFWKRIFDVIDIMIYFWLHNKTYLWRHAQLLYRPDIFVIISGTKYYENVYLMLIDIMIYYDRPFEVMACFWCHWRVFDVFLTSWLTFWSMLHLLTSWQTFWCHGIFWRHDTFLTHDMFFYIMTNVLSWWRIFVIISGTKYNVNVISIL